jgi:hypothetical protein
VRLVLVLALWPALCPAQRTPDAFADAFARATVRGEDFFFEALPGRGVRVTSLARDEWGLAGRRSEPGLAPRLRTQVRARLAEASLGLLDVEVDPHGTARIHGPVAHPDDGARAAFEALRVPGVIAVEVDVY